MRPASHVPHRCQRLVGLTVAEAKDCSRAASMGLEYKEPRPNMKQFSIDREVNEAVEKMMVRKATHALTVVHSGLALSVLALTGACLSCAGCVDKFLAAIRFRLCLHERLQYVTVAIALGL